MNEKNSDDALRMTFIGDWAAENQTNTFVPPCRRALISDIVNDIGRRCRLQGA